MEGITTEKFEKLIYRKLKNFFEGEVSERSWIWVDFFKDEQSGFAHFQYELHRDPDYKDLIVPESDIDEDAYSIVSDIHDKISGNSFIEMCGQINLSLIR